MKTSLTQLAALLPVLAFSAGAYAVPTLQVGAPAPAGQGVYADYSGSTTSPTEADTAITSGGTIYVGGAYGPNDLLIGGQYTGGLDWSGVDANLSLFDGHDAVLVASMLNTAGGSLTVNGLTSFATSSTLYFPNNHAPLGEASLFMYFDIGDFAKIVGAVDDFAVETGDATGEVKSLTIATSGFDWIHFDVMALVTSEKGTTISTTYDNNPGSHDVTWKKGDPTLPPNIIPEPNTPLLLGLGLIGLYMARRMHGRQG